MSLKWRIGVLQHVPFEGAEAIEKWIDDKGSFYLSRNSIRVKIRVKYYYDALYLLFLF